MIFDSFIIFNYKIDFFYKLLKLLFYDKKSFTKKSVGSNKYFQRK